MTEEEVERGAAEDAENPAWTEAEIVAAKLLPSGASLSPEQRAALSNTICGNRAAVCELEKMGLVTNVQFDVRDGEEIAFFDLTEMGKHFVEIHYHRAS